MKYLVVVALSFLLALPASAAEFNVNLKYGARGNEVKKLQEFLADNEFYSGPITGNFYSLTLKALKRFQLSRGLPQTGFFGGMTRAEANLMIENELKDQESEPEFTGAIEMTSSTNDLIDFQNKVLKAQLEEQQRQTQLLIEQGQKQQELINQLGQQQTSLNQVVNNTTPEILPETPQVISAPQPIPLSQVWDRKRLRVISYPQSNSVRFELSFFSTSTTITIFVDGKVATLQGAGPRSSPSVLIENVRTLDDNGEPLTYPYRLDFSGDVVGVVTSTFNIYNY